MSYFVYCKATYPNVDDFEVTAGFVAFGVDDGIVDEQDFTLVELDDLSIFDKLQL